VGAPYVSIRRLVDNSASAMLSAIEMYNKPQITYRDEITVILVVSAWELALKAALRQGKRSIFYRKERGQKYRSLTLDDALRRVSSHGLWPDQVDGQAVAANIKALAEYRDRAIHLYNAKGLGAVMYQFLQQNVLNYRDFMLARFNRDLADAVTWQLLPLGATAPSDAVEYMRVNKDGRMMTEVREFIDELRHLMDNVEKAGGDTARIATVYDINLQSVKKMTSADLVVAVSPDAQGRVVERRVDPATTHPYNQNDLLKRVNKKRTGRTITTYDHNVINWKQDLRDNGRYAWKHDKGASHVWSPQAVEYLASLPDTVYDEARREYQEHLRARTKRKSA
jgi:hypothetical protein